jgi:hypothetical protein
MQDSIRLKIEEYRDYYSDLTDIKLVRLADGCIGVIKDSKGNLDGNSVHALLILAGAFSELYARRETLFVKDPNLYTTGFNYDEMIKVLEDFSDFVEAALISGEKFSHDAINTISLSILNIAYFSGHTELLPAEN